MANYGPVVIGRWTGVISRRDLLMYCDHQLRVLETHRASGIACLFITALGARGSNVPAGSPSAVCRPVVPYLRCHAHVAEGSGMWLAAARGTLDVIGSPPYPSEVFSTVEEAVHWQVGMLTYPGLTEGGLGAAVERLRDAATWRAS